VAVGAFHAGMGRMEIGSVFRFHWGMARLPAKLHRFAIMIRPVGSNRCEKQENEAAYDEPTKDFAMYRPRQIDNQHMWQVSSRLLREMTSMNPAAKENQKNPKEQKPRCYYISENSEVRIAVGRKQVDGHQQQEGEEAAQGDNRSCQAQPVAKVPHKIAVPPVMEMNGGRRDPPPFTF